MFTGIIRKTSKIRSLEKKAGSLFLSFDLPKGWKIKLGGSISINGICSTLREVSKTAFAVEYMPETLQKTTASFWKKGDEVNLEQSLKLADTLDGHFVSGHVDTMGEVMSVVKKGNSTVLKIKIPKELAKYIAEKGSITVDGVSLTVVSQSEDWFTVSLVSYTLENANLKSLRVGSRVNIEIDIIAKYLAKLIAKN